MKIAFIESDFENAGVVRIIVEGAVSDAGHDLIAPYNDLPMDETSELENFRDKLEELSLVIVESSTLSPLASFKIGAALQAGKPIISLAISGSNVPPSVLHLGAHLSYQFSERIGIVQKRLTEMVNKVLSSTDFSSDAINHNQVQRRHKLFISYSHKDKPFLERLLVHLRPLERAGKIELWSDTQLRAGDRWKAEIQNGLERATIAVLLVSADFMASEFIISNELPPLLKNAEERGTKILPLILKPCRFLRDPDLSQFQAANVPTKAFILLSEGEQETLFDQVATEVERFVGVC